MTKKKGSPGIAVKQPKIWRQFDLLSKSCHQAAVQLLAKLSRQKRESQKKKIDPIPEEFSSYEEAAEFWDKHDTTEYVQDAHPVRVESEFRGRRYEIEIDEPVTKILHKAARRKGVTPSRLASELSRQRLGPRA